MIDRIERDYEIDAWSTGYNQVTSSLAKIGMLIFLRLLAFDTILLKYTFHSALG